LVAEAELNLRPSGLNRGIPLFVEHCRAAAAEIDIGRRWLGEQERRVLNRDVDERRGRHVMPADVCKLSNAGIILRLLA
jgi:hypothetical protein